MKALLAYVDLPASFLLIRIDTVASGHNQITKALTIVITGPNLAL